MHMKSGSASELRAMNSMFRRGPVTIMLVFSTTCPHCTTYMPIWKKLCETQGRKANMISMEASTYNKTPLAEQKPVSGVPTVLYVDPQGTISEASEPRNTEVMTNAVKVTSGSDLPASVAVSNTNRSNSNMSNRSNALNVESTNAMKIASNAIIPGTTTSENPLNAIPASVVPQSGGNPWAAFLLAARQAAPAAALLGAYAALPMKRSSGLSDPVRRTRKTRRKSNRHN